jgi:hypothetical protein
MIENIELAHEMALAEDTYRDVEIFASKLGLAVLSPMILKVANRETAHIYQQWRQEERSADLDRKQAERDAIIDAMAVEQMRTHMTKEDFVEDVTAIGYSKHFASRTWHIIEINDYSAHHAIGRHRSYYPLTFMKVPLPDYSRYTKKIDVLDMAMLKDALVNSRETMHNGVEKHLSLTENALTMLDELVRMHQQPAGLVEQ